MLIYDVYLRKEKSVLDEEDKQEFSLAEMADNTITNVDFDEVEQMTTSSKIEVNENDIFSSATDSENTDEPSSENLEALKRKFEEEEHLDDNEADNEGGQTEVFTPINKEEILKRDNERFKNLLSLAETNVQVIFNESENGGYKTFKAQPKTNV
jgi:hypothetical protein